MGDALAAEIAATDYHTAGEPFRIVTAGVPPIAGATVRERRERAAASEPVETVRRLLCHEPRGHADMYGCFLVAPDDDGADLGVLFWHKDGYSTACGHGTIALGAWAVESGAVAAPRDGEVDVTIDVPSGRVVARVRVARRGRRVGRLPQRALVRRRARRAGRGRRGRRVLRRRDLRLGPRRALRACASPPTTCPRSSPPGARSSRRSRAPTSPATPTTSACRASTGRSSTRTSAPCTSAT